MNNAQRVAAFIADNPGCTVTDIEIGTNWSCVWVSLMEAERAGLITSDNSEHGIWRFHAKEGVND